MELKVIPLTHLAENIGRPPPPALPALPTAPSAHGSLPPHAAPGRVWPPTPPPSWRATAGKTWPSARGTWASPRATGRPSPSAPSRSRPPRSPRSFRSPAPAWPPSPASDHALRAEMEGGALFGTWDVKGKYIYLYIDLCRYLYIYM